MLTYKLYLINNFFTVFFCSSRSISFIKVATRKQRWTRHTHSSPTSSLTTRPSEQRHWDFESIHEHLSRLTTFQVSGTGDRTTAPWNAKPALYPLHHGGHTFLIFMYVIGKVKIPPYLCIDLPRKLEWLFTYFHPNIHVLGPTRLFGTYESTNYHIQSQIKVSRFQKLCSIPPN